MALGHQKTPGRLTSDPNVYRPGGKRTQDSKYRNVFAPRERVRGNRPKATSRAGVYAGSALAGVLFFVGALLIGGIVLLVSAVLNQMISGVRPPSYGAELKTIAFSFPWSLLLYGGAILVSWFAYLFFDRNWKAQNVQNLNPEMLTQENDAYIQVPEELSLNFDVFPDSGAHSEVSPTAVLAHQMLRPAGLKHIRVARRYNRTTIVTLPDGRRKRHLKGEPVRKPDGSIVYDTKPLIDQAFGEALFTASDIPDGKEGKSLRVHYDARHLLYNPKGRRGKAKVKTVAEHINRDWTFPVYERQRPAGMYIVDTEPNNTMVLAMTRAGKGQTIIEPTIDMWTREKHLNNMTINDPKGELYVKFYYPASVRGFDVVAFNLINESRTNIYNPLGYAVEAAREGNNQKVEELVKSIGDVFFPTEKDEDPMWQNAANAAFQRSALGLIDFYQEEDRETRLKAVREHWDSNVLDQKLDELWGHVTMYNVYQMMTQLASKKSKDEELIHITDDDPAKEKDYLTLFFDATNALPKNALRQSAANADNSLRTMAGSEKTIASVYGISLTAMRFFADEKISRLTSGRPSQNFDMIGLGFPRRIGIQLDYEYMMHYNYRGQRTKWTAYRDPGFKNPYQGEDFEHTGRVNSNGWSFYFFKGIFESMKTYLKLEIFDDTSGLVVKRFYFQFTKGYQKSLNGRTFVKHPVSHQRIIHDGTLREMRRTRSGHWVIRPTLRKRQRVSLIDTENGAMRTDRVPVISQIEIHYTEKPKAVFFITPPHLVSYAKIVLVLINQMFNMQVDKSYLTKPNQKPLYKTRNMLDEVGNLQSEGHGIPYLQTKESIGLGQDQQYTLILQTLQQLKDVYGESVDKILQGNTGNIIYLKSTDDSMLETLEKMSGVKHEAYVENKTVTTDMRAVVNAVEGHVSRTTVVKELPTISRNDMLFIPKNNAMVFGKGNPIWARNQLVMPMSWRLHQNQLVDPKKGAYTLENVPTTMNTDDFDVRANQPNFFKMVHKRVRQARHADEIMSRYKTLHHLSDDGFSRLDQESLARELMQGINEQISSELKGNDEAYKDDNLSPDEIEETQARLADEQIDASYEEGARALEDGAMENAAVEEAVSREDAKNSEQTLKRYAESRISRKDLKPGDRYNHNFDKEISQVYDEIHGDFANDPAFHYDSATRRLTSADGEIYIRSIYDEKGDYAHDVKQLRHAAADESNTRVQSTPEPQTDQNDDMTPEFKYGITDAFYAYLISLDSWQGIANGHFETKMAQAYDRRETL